MEKIWSGLLTVVGKAECGNRTVTFYEPPGCDPNGRQKLANGSTSGGERRVAGGRQFV